MIDLLLPIRTFATPVIIPLTTTITGAVFFSSTAAVNSGKVETVVMVPPLPPVVLYRLAAKGYSQIGLHEPSIQGSITKCGFV